MTDREGATPSGFDLSGLSSPLPETTFTLERGLVETGMGAPLAKATALAFTFYMLDYVTLEGAAQAIHSAGASSEEARRLALQFKEFGR